MSVIVHAPRQVKGWRPGEARSEQGERRGVGDGTRHRMGTRVEGERERGVTPRLRRIPATQGVLA